MESSGRLIVERQGCVAIARIRDRLPNDTAVGQIREGLERLLLDLTVKHVVIDFSEVEFFEANLRGQLVLLRSKLQARGGRLGLCGLSPCMREHPTMVQFGQLMAIGDRLEDALGRLGDDRP